MASIGDTNTTKDNSELFPPLPENWTLVSAADDGTSSTDGWEPIDNDNPSASKPAYAAVTSRGLNLTSDNSSADSTVTMKTCPTCSFLNHIDIFSCEMCGTAFELPKSINIPASTPSNAHERHEIQKACPSCTFLNHWALKECEVCNASLDNIKEQPKGNTEVDDKFSEQDQDDLDEIDAAVMNKQAGKRFRDVVLRQ